MNEFTKDKSYQLMNDFLSFYIEKGFGQKLKSEIDLNVFQIMLQFNGFLGINENTDLTTLSLNDITKISRKLKIPKSRVMTLLEKIQLISGKELDNSAFLENLGSSILSNYQSKELLEKGRFSLYIPNKLFREEVELRIANLNFIPDYSFNRSIMIIDVFALALLFDGTEYGNELIKKINSINLSKVKQNEKLITEINKLSGIEKVKRISMNLGKLVIGELSDDLFNLGSEIINHLSKRK